MTLMQMDKMFPPMPTIQGGTSMMRLDNSERIKAFAKELEETRPTPSRHSSQRREIRKRALRALTRN